MLEAIGTEDDDFFVHDAAGTFDPSEQCSVACTPQDWGDQDPEQDDSSTDAEGVDEQQGEAVGQQ